MMPALGARFMGNVEDALFVAGRRATHPVAELHVLRMLETLMMEKEANIVTWGEPSRQSQARARGEFDEVRLTTLIDLAFRETAIHIDLLGAQRPQSADCPPYTHAPGSNELVSKRLVGESGR